MVIIVFNLHKFADLIVNYCLEVQPKQTIQINADVAAIHFVEELYKEILLSGGYPILELMNTNFTEIFYKNASEDQLGYISPISLFKAKNIDSIIEIRSQPNTKAFANLDMTKQRIRRNALLPLNEEIDKKRWVLTLFPTEGYAQEAEMSMIEFNAFISSALFLDTKNPKEAWINLSKQQERYIGMINKFNEIHIRGENIDLIFSVEGRKWINSDGKRNMPSGEIYTSPIEDSFNGYFTSTIPNNKYGKEINNVRLEFSNGKIIKIKTDKNKDFLDGLLSTDDGAKIIGEFGIGLNYGIKQKVNNILFDEKIGGTIHLALGKAYEIAGGKNKSNIHLDLVADLRKFGEITYDNNLLYKNGYFLQS